MNTLTHHGIKGMRWGVRRYQNSDGTLTSAGKKRYRSAVERKITDNVSRRLHDTNDDFEDKHAHLLDTDLEKYFDERDKYETNIWDDERRTTGKRLYRALDEFRILAKSTKELDRMMRQTIDSVASTPEYKAGLDYVKRRYSIS